MGLYYPISTGFPHSSLGNTTLSSKKRLGIEHCSPGCEIKMFSDFGWLNPFFKTKITVSNLGSFRWTKNHPSQGPPELGAEYFQRPNFRVGDGVHARYGLEGDLRWIVRCQGGALILAWMVGLFEHGSGKIITTSLRPHRKSWLIREIIPKWPYFSLVNYYNLSRWIIWDNFSVEIWMKQRSDF